MCVMNACFVMVAMKAATYLGKNLGLRVEKLLFGVGPGMMSFITLSLNSLKICLWDI